MVSIAERVAYLEGQSGPQVAAIDDLRVQVGGVRGEVGGLRGELGELRGELGELRGELGELRGEVRELRRDMDRRLERLEDKVDRRFTWLVGMQVATLLGVIAALAAPYFR